MAKIEKILVVGGGVAGLTAAAALHQRGFRTELVERQQTWRALGAGFLVHANGMRMLLALGLAASVENAGTIVCRWQFCDEQGDLLSETDLEALWGDVALVGDRKGYRISACVILETPRWLDTKWTQLLGHLGKEVVRLINCAARSPRDIDICPI